MQGDFRIGDWTIHPTINFLERDHETVHLEPKVMQVLLALAEEPGEVVNRERIRNAVWPDVFVGEDVLIRAISELRRAFSDDPKSPHTIQTVPKVGYRLIASVSLIPSELRSGAVTISPSAEVLTPTYVDPDPSTSNLEVSTEYPIAAAGPSTRRVIAIRAILIILSLVILGAISSLLLVKFLHRPSRSSSYTSRPLTTYPGSELQAAFSPDGSTIAFVWRKQGERNGHIYIKSLNAAKFLTSEAPVRLTSGAADETSPAWSPNGHFIAFIQHDEEHSSVAVIPAIGGNAQEVYTLPANNVWEYGGLTWSADGNKLIFPQMRSLQSPSELVELAIKDRTVNSLTSPPAGWDGDWTPTLSPDGTKLAFVRGPDRSARDIYVMSLPNGTPQQLTHDARLIVGLTWSEDGSSIVFSSNRGGSVSLWRIPSTGGTPEHEPAGGEDAYGPSIARQGNRMIYSHGNAIWSILDVNLAAKNADEPTEILTSSEQDASPHVSPLGGVIAFQSWRSGSQEIWTAAVDGSNPIQLTSAGASAGSPSWSPDGKTIAFDARPDSFAHIFVIDASGGTPRALTSGKTNDIVPSWSPDGRTLYFGSNRSGSWEIWKIPADGSASPQQVTKSGGMIALANPSGKSIFYTKFDEPGIWELSLSDASERKIFDGPSTDSPAYWTVYKDKLYALHEPGGLATIEEIDAATGHHKVVYTLKHAPTPFAGLSVTPDGSHIILAELTQASSGLMLIEHFQ